MRFVTNADLAPPSWRRANIGKHLIPVPHTRASVPLAHTSEEISMPDQDIRSLDVVARISLSGVANGIAVDGATPR
jgi:hypothetical protein